MSPAHHHQTSSNGTPHSPRSPQSPTSPHSPRENPISVQIDSTDAQRRTSDDSERAAEFRRRGRKNTFNTSYTDKFGTKRVGAEPGVDVQNDKTVRLDLVAECAITVVDYNQEKINVTELVNATLPSFLDQERPEWSKVRWININGKIETIVQKEE